MKRLLCKSVEENILGHSINLQKAYQDLLQVQQDKRSHHYFTSDKHRALFALLHEQAKQIQELLNEELCATAKNT
jgi:hypothetical protein